LLPCSWCRWRRRRLLLLTGLLLLLLLLLRRRSRNRRNNSLLLQLLLLFLLLLLPLQSHPLLLLLTYPLLLLLKDILLLLLSGEFLLLLVEDYAWDADGRRLRIEEHIPNFFGEVGTFLLAHEAAQIDLSLTWVDSRHRNPFVLGYRRQEQINSSALYDLVFESEYRRHAVFDPLGHDGTVDFGNVDILSEVLGEFGGLKIPAQCSRILDRSRVRTSDRRHLFFLNGCFRVS